MKLKDNCNQLNLNEPVDIDKMHGHTTITLTNVKTGEVEVYEDDNMMTNAIKEYFRNCGFMNYPDLDKATLVETLLGGIMGFDTAMTESADIVRVPAGEQMVFNGALGASSTGATELGSCSSVATETGWQDDGSFLVTYDFTTAQGNCKQGQSIACVCLTSADYGYIGDGNSNSLAKNSNLREINTLLGSVASYSGIPGWLFHYDFADSSVMSFSVEDVEVGTSTEKKAFLRKYRLPLTKLNLKGKPTAPVMLSETEITVDSDFLNSNLLAQANSNGNLEIWNYHAAQDYLPVWGTDWTQYVWTLTSAGVLTKTTISNTSGVDLPGLQMALFDGNYIFFCYAWGANRSAYASSETIYVLNRSTGTITSISNPYGHVSQAGWYATGSWLDYRYQVGFLLHHGTGNGKIMTQGMSYSVIIDTTLSKVFPNNGQSNIYPVYSSYEKAQSLIGFSGLSLYRDKFYIATINNLETPVQKTADKTMKVVYRITFDEEQGTNS